ncbi:transporter substrate-binding domain-containing protein [Duganella sp. sic0402]|uniref:substrate-binding periplasmic protein n=1 Tax=Duganella sp. sic0402 TaxID=2854786 RepID=UPI001C485B34|nr:ABC transporter substrate-binding protein [Duganella sp. sic0402]MBV7538491.1 transporter substrate-binding domain-containing protein [Duganella sp. sic0402]
MFRHAFVACALAALLPAAAAYAADKDDEIPVLIAETVDPRGNMLPTPPVITAVISQLAAESGLHLVIQAYPWRRAQLMAENGEGLLYGAAITPERLGVFRFTKPLYAANQWLVSSAQTPLIFRRWSDLRGKVISIGSGGKYGPEFEARRGKLFKVEENAASMESRLKMLSAHHVDGVLVDSFRNPVQLGASLNCRFPSDRWTVASKSVGFEPLLIAVPKSGGYTKLLPVLNQAITRISKSGSIQKAIDSVANVSGC